MSVSRGGRRGQAIVEFAMVLPVFLVLLFALLDFGRVVFAQNTVAQAAREASRFAAVADSHFDCGAVTATAIRNAPGLGLNNGDVSCSYPDGALPGGRAVVTVSTRVELLTPLISQLLGGSFVVESTSRGYIP